MDKQKAFPFIFPEMHADGARKAGEGVSLDSILQNNDVAERKISDKNFEKMAIAAVKIHLEKYGRNIEDSILILNALGGMSRTVLNGLMSQSVLNRASMNGISYFFSFNVERGPLKNLLVDCCENMNVTSLENMDVLSVVIMDRDDIYLYPFTLS